MAKSTKGAKKKTTPHKKSVRAVYDCQDVERYLDRAIERVKEEVLPKIETLDERDKTQYSMAKKIMEDAAVAAKGRQEQIEKKVDTVGKELEEIYQARKQMTDHLTSSFNALHGRFEDLHTKLDTHIEDESKEFATIRDGLTKAATHVETIQKTLDEVSANGNKGLSASMTDVYNKLKDLESVTEGARARVKFYNVLHDVVSTTPLLKPLKYKWGSVLYAAIILLVVNTVVHALGVQWDLMGIFTWAIGLLKGGS
jgi:DNA repair exonuclease SbcCD ATPase subunit